MSHEQAHEQVSVRTRDGGCPVHVFTPKGAASSSEAVGQNKGPWPGAIMYMDGLGIRPAMLAMGQRLADAGYVVLLPDLYYRVGPYAPLDPKKVFASENPMAVIGPLFSSTNPKAATDDTEAFLAYLDSRQDVAGRKIGIVGYCMGGAMVLTVAATYPDRIAAAASFHGGNLANDTETSPHLLAPKMKARIFVAAADNDPFYPPEMGERLERALREAGVDHRCETYSGAAHGWTMTDFPIYDESAAERHWRDLQALFAATLI